MTLFTKCPSPNRNVLTVLLFLYLILSGGLCASNEVDKLVIDSQTSSPDNPRDALILAKTVAEQMVVALADGTVRNNMSELRAVVDRYLVPHIDFRTSSNLVLAQHWKSATEAQRIEFINEFRAFLVRFYTEALSGYVKSREVPRDLIKFSDDIDIKSAKQVLITSHVKQPDGGTVPVVYRMIWNQAWQVVDVSLKGISMVKTYRANFVSTVEAEGIDQLIRQLKERNAALAE